MGSRKDSDPPEESEQELEQQHADIDFVTFGMLILDDIDFAPPTPSRTNVLGGAGSYAALGARLFSPPPLSSTVGWIVDQGSDFPPAVTALIDSWGTGAVMRHDADRLTTRGWNGYGGGGAGDKRDFKYLTPKKRITTADLPPNLLQSKSFHLICSPTRCQELVTSIIARRKEAAPPETYTKPVFVWEPVPDLCTPDELLNLTNTLPLVDVCSPNHSELAGFMGDDGLDPVTGDISTRAIERACEQLLDSMPLQSFAIVVRAAHKGCYVVKNGGRKRRPGGGSKSTRKKNYTRGGLRPDIDMTALLADLIRDEDGLVVRDEIEVDPGVERWIPAYFKDSKEVVDPTGGGNTFLGGMTVALARGKSYEEAAVWGTVAASFAVQQVGMPTLERRDDKTETWNGSVVLDRLHEFEARL
ncbi:Ribokinase-like protein [Trichoderma longibrachiatum]